MFPDWPELAAFAYGCYLDEGRGLVLLGGKEWRYETDEDKLCLKVFSCHEKINIRRTIRTYDPESQVAFMIATDLYVQTGLSVWRPPIMHSASKQGGWDQVMQRYRGLRPTTLNEEYRQVLSFRWSERRRRF